MSETDNGIIVLVVEDDHILRYLAKRQLGTMGIACETACNGAQAMEMLSKQRFALVLMDVQMPVMDGYQTTVAIRASEAGADHDEHIPIVAMTAMPKRQQCLDSGMDDFMLKPIELEQLQSVVTKWLPEAA